MMTEDPDFCEFCEMDVDDLVVVLGVNLPASLCGRCHDRYWEEVEDAMARDHNKEMAP